MPYYLLTLIIPLLLLSSAALPAAPFLTILGLHKMLQSLIMLLDLVLHVIYHLFLHFIELVNLLCRL